jgi:predicted secreted protein
MRVIRYLFSLLTCWFWSLASPLRNERGLLGKAAKGLQLKMGDGASPEAFTTIAEVKDITFPLMSVDQLDGTNHDRPGDWAEIILTILRHPEVTFRVNFLPNHATHNNATGYQGLAQAKTLRNWQLVIPQFANATYAFQSYVTGVSILGPVAGMLEGDITLKPTGAVTIP